MSSSDAKEEELCSYGTMTKGRPPEKQPRWRPSVFDFKSGGTCPTCQGTGKIPKGEDSYTQLRFQALLMFKRTHLTTLHTCRPARWACGVDPIQWQEIKAKENVSEKVINGKLFKPIFVECDLYLTALSHVCLSLIRKCMRKQLELPFAMPWAWLDCNCTS